MDYKKPQSTLVQGGAGIYPLTTADQVILADGSRLEKDGKISADSAANSAKLGGKAPEYYIQPRNLLDNSDFKNPVNQRGIYSAINGSYIIDRWNFHNSKHTGNVTITQSTNGITITNDAGADTIAIVQRFIDKNYYDGKYTAVAKTTDGLVFGYVEVSDSENSVCQMSIWLTNGATVVWAALYEGTYTADTLPPYVPKGYAAELAECNSAPVDLGGGYGGGSLQAYPVGAIYISTIATSPASLFGGTWEQIAQGRMLVGMGAIVANNTSYWGTVTPGEVNTAHAGEMGGEAWHALTVSELPVLSGSISMHGEGVGGSVVAGVSGVFSAAAVEQGYQSSAVNSGATSVSRINFNAGSGQRHNNLPPYLAVYMWKRVS